MHSGHYPAVLVSAVYSPAFMRPGVNSISLEPRCTPVTWPLQMRCASWMPFRCCAASPGFLRPARILRMRTGFLVNALNATAMRRIWPPCNVHQTIGHTWEVGLLVRLENQIIPLLGCCRRYPTCCCLHKIIAAI